MNKKLLFTVMSLAALTACTNDDFESKQSVAEEISPVQFEVINDAQTRAFMDNNDLVWEASKGDLFTLYHGAADGATSGFENATYKATAAGANATLTTPSMIKEGKAIMVYPVDTTFRIPSSEGLTIAIPDEQKADVENYIPYVSDLIGISAHVTKPANTDPGYNTAGKDRKYPVYMRPMASQLNLKADYGNTEDLIKELYEGETGVAAGEGIDPIKVTSIELQTKDVATTPFTKEIKVKWTAPTSDQTTQWALATNNRAWEKVTDFGEVPEAGKVIKLTTTCLLDNNEGCKFLILPQAKMTTVGSGVSEAAVVVNTQYGKVVIQDPAVTGTETKYSATEIADAWYRYLSEKPATDEDGETTGDSKVTAPDGTQKYKTTSKPEFGMKQTINFFTEYKAKSGTVKDEPRGTAVTRYVKVLLSHLDMSALHIKTDKQLRDVARVWKKLGLDPVTVYLDGGTTGEFTITQKTIDVINTVNATATSFKVKPCQDTSAEHGKCTKIVITENSGNANVKNVAFIAKGDGDEKVEVVLANEATAWNWAGTVKVDDAAVSKFTNKGTMTNSADATLKTTKDDGTQNDVLLVNDNAWNITAGTVFVQFDVTNNGTVTISKGAEYRQDGTNHDFINDATTYEARFLANPANEKVGKVNNSGVFATVNGGKIKNYGLIEHADPDAKTYISQNDNAGAGFGTERADGNKIGRINLPYSNKDEDNISVNSELNKGFISVTVTAAELAKAGITSKSLDASIVGNKVNYIIVNSGITAISAVSSNIKYLEIADVNNTEIAWNVSSATEYEGLIVLSKVNIKQGTSINVKTGIYLGETMYVGGTFKKNGSAVTNSSFTSYYGDTNANFATKYVTY